MKFVFAGILAIFMLMQSLIPRVATDLLHSPEVWKHFIEHQKEQKPPLDFFDFLSMHFSADSKHTKQKKHHLPSFDFNSIVGFCVLPTATIAYLNTVEIIFSTKAQFQWANLYNYQATEALICPPRV